MEIDRERIDTALKALRQCNEIEAACAIYTYEGEASDGKRGRPRGSKNKPRKVLAPALPPLGESEP